MTFSNNGNISENQVVRMLVLDLFAGASLFLPMALPRVSGDGGGFAFLFGVGLTWIYVRLILKRVGTGDGKGLKKILGIRCFLTYVFLLGLFIAVLHETFLFTMSRGWIILGMLCALIYGASKRLEVRARLAEFLFYFILIPIFLIGTASLSQAQWSNIMEMKDIGVSGILQGSLITWVLMSPIEWHIYRNCQMAKVVDKKAFHRALVAGLGLVGIIYLLCIIVLGINGMRNERWPTSILMQIVKLPGGFLSRQDGLMLSFWVFSMFLSLLGATASAREFLFRENERVRGGKQSILIVLGGILSYFIGTNRTFLTVYFVLMILSGLWVLLPVRKCTCVFMILFMLIFSGCDNYVELENRDFVMAIGVDPGENKEYRFTFTFSDLGEITGNSDDNAIEPILLEARSLTEAERIYNQMSENYMDFGQVKVIVLGEGMKREKNAVKVLVQEIKNRPEMARTILMCKSLGDARNILSMGETMTVSVGIYLEELLNNHESDVVFNAFLGTEDMGILPEVRIFKERIYLE